MKYTICLIDDDAIYQFTARKIMESTGLVKKVYSFSNGNEALRYFNELAESTAPDFPDIIFLDINMPVMDGWEFLEAYEKLHQQLSNDIPLYMVSSSINEADIRHSQTFRSVDGYLVKPVAKVRYQELLDSLEKGRTPELS